MTPKPILTRADIDLLKSTFVTKDDLVGMETRQDKKYATKEDLNVMEKRQDQKHATKNDMLKMEKRLSRRFRRTDNLIIETFDKITLNHGGRLTRIEEHLGLTTPGKSS